MFVGSKEKRMLSLHFPTTVVCCFAERETGWRSILFQTHSSAVTIGETSISFPKNGEKKLIPKHKSPQSELSRARLFPPVSIFFRNGTFCGRIIMRPSTNPPRRLCIYTSGGSHLCTVTERQSQCVHYGHNPVDVASVRFSFGCGGEGRERKRAPYFLVCFSSSTINTLVKLTCSLVSLSRCSFLPFFVCKTFLGKRLETMTTEKKNKNITIPLCYFEPLENGCAAIHPPTDPSRFWLWALAAAAAGLLMSSAPKVFSWWACENLAILLLFFLAGAGSFSLRRTASQKARATRSREGRSSAKKRGMRKCRSKKHGCGQKVFRRGLRRRWGAAGIWDSSAPEEKKERERKSSETTQMEYV